MIFEKVARPEDAGVNSSVVLEFLKLLDKLKVDNHSFVLIKDDKIVIENYTAPFCDKYAHSCFSVSKGLISTAVAYAIEDGKMTLDTPILNFFPEYNEYIKKDIRNGEVTVRDLLTMSSGKKCKFVKDMTAGNYADDWIKYKFRNDKNFMYSNDDVYMLAKAITRIYGQSITEMLTPRLYEPLDISQHFWETTAEGIEAGATGLYLRPFDLAKIAYCYLNNGKFDGKQIIPEFWPELASKYYVKLPTYYNTSKDYGFFFWGDPNGDYRFDGMYGQWAIVFKKHNAVLVFNNQSCAVQAVIDEMWKYFPRAFIEPSDGSKTDELLARLHKNEKVVIPISKRKAIEKKVEGKTYKMPKYSRLDFLGYPISMLPLVVSSTMPQKAKRSMDKVSFNFYDKGFNLSWSEGDEKNTVDVALDGTLAESVVTLGTFDYKMLSNGEWIDDFTLKVIIRPIETPVCRNIVFKFKKNKLRIKLSSTPTVKEFCLGYMGEVSIKPTKFVRAFLEIPFRIMEPNLRARTKIDYK